MYSASTSSSSISFCTSSAIFSVVAFADFFFSDLAPPLLFSLLFPPFALALPALPSCFSAFAPSALAPFDFDLDLPPLLLLALLAPLDLPSCFSAFAPSALAPFDFSFDFSFDLPPLPPLPPSAFAALVEGVATGSIGRRIESCTDSLALRTGAFFTPSCSSCSVSFSTGSSLIRKGSSLRTGSFKSLSMPMRPWASSLPKPFK
mmetsp:Transcript_28792/g.42961  ORF Transcript_28792/g.42961 Transcript_28792/m.42961 type:complete len:204 (+) Transcript_28792:108-719(+)